MPLSLMDWIRCCDHISATGPASAISLAPEIRFP